jgi:hypothetical protein
MSTLTVTVTEHEGHCTLDRSDGKRFTLAWREDGSASLYEGDFQDPSPVSGVHLDKGIGLKVDAARKLVLDDQVPPR